MYTSPQRRPGRNPYRETSVETASPEQQLVMLLDGAIRYCARAGAGIESGDLANKGVNVGKAQAIVQELQAILDHEAAPELCGTLNALYDYMGDRLTHANIHNDAPAVADVASLLGTIRAGFAEAASISRRECSPVPADVSEPDNAAP